MIGLVLLLIVSSSFVYSYGDAPRVKIPLGSIKGYYKISEYGRLYDAYEGIPYAQPPTGKRRFKSPSPITAWQGELQATKLAHECIQYIHKPDHVKSDRVIGSEDCLFLNVYVPEKDDDSNSNLPVIIWIHGGALMHGTGNKFAAKYLIDRNVIVVTVNYRVGPLGFLSTEDDVVPGNMGLKDQSLALRWVHENIEFFRGDPKRITLLGQSAGGVSVHYHYFSPLSAGLFRNGISLSGTVLNCWAQTENALEKAKRLGALMGCPTENNKEMVKCLKYRPARSIVQAVKEFMSWLYNPITPFGPVVEKSGDKPFINRSPVEILESGDVLDALWITSVTSDEGLYPVAEFALQKYLLKELDENWESIAPHLLEFNYTVPLKIQSDVAKTIRQHYLGNKPIDGKSVKAITQMIGDRLFVLGAEKAAKMQAKANKESVLFYYYTYRGTSSLSNLLSGTKNNFGVSHADDILFLIENDLVEQTTEQTDRDMQNDLLQIMVSVAENGEQNLTPIWKKVDPTQEDIHYLEISGPKKFKVNSNKNLGQKKFWSTINFSENISKSNLKEEL